MLYQHQRHLFFPQHYLLLLLLLKMLMTFHLNALPEDCLRLILEKVTLMELLSLRLVCSRWRLVIEQMCRRRRSLAVFECLQDQLEFSSMRYYFLENAAAAGEGQRARSFAAGDSVLIIGGGGVLLRHLADLFPNVSSLLLLYSHACLTLTERPPPPSLTSLTIVSKRRSTEIAAKLWSWIDDIDRLRSLSLFGLFDNRLPLRLQALSRLELFSLSGYSDDLVPVVGQFGPRLRHLLLDRLSLPVSRLETLLRESAQCRQWAAGVRHLSIGSLNTGMVCAKGYVEKITHFLAFFCRHFTQVTSLQVRFALQIPLGRLVAELGRLPALTELRLAQIGSSNPRTEPDRRTLQCLTSVRRLFLECTTAKAAQDTFWKFWIPVIFPNLETWSLAPECSFNGQSGSSCGRRLNHMRVQ